MMGILTPPQRDHQADHEAHHDHSDHASLKALAVYHPLEHWVMQQGLDGLSLQDMLNQFGERITALGFPLLRLFVGVRTLHPLYSGYGFVWRRNAPMLEENTFSRSDKTDSHFMRSPVHYLSAQNLPYLRQRLDGPASPEFDIYDRFRAEGATDYYLSGTSFQHVGERDLSGDGSEGVMISWTTDQAGGFSETDLLVIQHFMPLLALAIKSTTTYSIARSVLETYIGRDAGRRVLEGAITRGAIETIDAVILFTDLRGFTALSDRLPPDELVSALDDYMECMAEPVIAHNGEVLKYMGDGLLAIFRLGDDAGATACHDAMAAAQTIFKRVREMNLKRLALNKEILEPILALHLGKVQYGNVGTESRLDFTVIGPAVNEAARIEGLCREMGHAMLISDSFAEAAILCQQFMQSIGYHRLRGVQMPRELYIPKPGSMEQCIPMEELSLAPLPEASTSAQQGTRNILP